MSRVQNFEQLLALDDESFIQEAYQLFLRRSPALADVRHYLRVLSMGADKWGVAINIATSPEAARYEQTLEGLAAALNWRRKELRRPFGPLYRAVRIISRLYLSLRRLEARLSRIEATLSRLEAQGALAPQQGGSRYARPLRQGRGEDTFPTLTLSAQRAYQKLTR